MGLDRPPLLDALPEADLGPPHPDSTAATVSTTPTAPIRPAAPGTRGPALRGPAFHHRPLRCTTQPDRPYGLKPPPAAGPSPRCVCRTGPIPRPTVLTPPVSNFQRGGRPQPAADGCPPAISRVCDAPSRGNSRRFQQAQAQARSGTTPRGQRSLASVAVGTPAHRDPRPATHDPRPTTHDPRPTHAATATVRTAGSPPHDHSRATLGR